MDVMKLTKELIIANTRESLEEAGKEAVKWLGEAKNDNINFDFCPVTGNPKFMSARNAVALIPDDACIMGMGMPVSMRPAVLWYALGNRYETTGTPKNLTVITAGGAGGRGKKIPGSVEEIGLKGLNTVFISGHLETAVAQLKLGDQGDCVLGVLPQGVIAHLAEAQARGEDSIVTNVGVGTFMDPRVGTGSQVIPGTGEQMVVPEGDSLRYTMPKITVACVIAPSADMEGNIYVKDAGMFSELPEAVYAAKKNGGISIITVAQIIPRDESAIYIKSEFVDAIVVNPGNEMTCTVKQINPWKELLPGGEGDVVKAMSKIKALNSVLKIDPERSDIDIMLARQAAKVFSEISHPEAYCVIGYGLPQEVSRQTMIGGIGEKLTFMVETGIYGGLPAEGILFGTAYHPRKLMSSAQLFRLTEEKLDMTVLGMLQVDEKGNVNVSQKAKGALNYIGPGGFLNLVAAAKKIIFVGQFMARSKMEIIDNRLNVIEPGISKFVREVDEITFSAKEALKYGKEVYYVTPVAVFRLTDRGVELVSVAPGVDVEKDILANSEARIVLPADGSIGIFDESVITGQNYSLKWN